MAQMRAADDVLIQSNLGGQAQGPGSPQIGSTVSLSGGQIVISEVRQNVNGGFVAPTIIVGASGISITDNNRSTSAGTVTSRSLTLKDNAKFDMEGTASLSMIDGSNVVFGQNANVNFGNNTNLSTVSTGAVSGLNGNYSGVSGFAQLPPNTVSVNTLTGNDRVLYLSNFMGGHQIFDITGAVAPNNINNFKVSDVFTFITSNAMVGGTDSVRVTFYHQPDFNIGFADITWDAFNYGCIRLMFVGFDANVPMFRIV
jgi:hypothetical protein